MKTDMIKNEYLGDGVYANQGRFNGEIVLTTGEPHGPEYFPENEIFLDAELGKNLYRYLKNIFEN